MTSPHRITVAVLGTGRQGRAHAQSLLEIGREGLAVGDRTYAVDVLLYGRDPGKLAKLAEELGVEKTTTDWRQAVMAPDVDIVDNCLINAMHYEPLLLAAEHGKHCIAEKPLTGDPRTAEALLAAAERAGVRHTIIQNMRYQPGPAAAKELLRQGRLGRIFHIRAVFGYYVPETITNRPAWFYQRQQAGGGIVADIMAHFFDLFRWLIGPIEGVFCQAATYLPNRQDAQGRAFVSDVEDAAALVLRFAGGAIGDVFLSWVRRKHEAMPQFEIDGQAGSLLFSYDRLYQQLGTEAMHSFVPFGAISDDPLSEWNPVPLPVSNPFRLQLEGFLRAVITGAPFEPNWHTALVNERLLELAYRSAREGRMFWYQG
ncbi:MAG: Gfo/Idh/MocA family protein [Anaerolineae bacterium]